MCKILCISANLLIALLSLSLSFVRFTGTDHPLLRFFPRKKLANQFAPLAQLGKGEREREREGINEAFFPGKRVRKVRKNKEREREREKGKIAILHIFGGRMIYSSNRSSARSLAGIYFSF